MPGTKEAAREIDAYNRGQEADHAALCDLLASLIRKHLPEGEGRIWHAHPVWFIEENPVVGYSVQKKGVRLMFWSGRDFDEDGLDVHGAKFRDASIFLNAASDVNRSDLRRWLGKARDIQWDYKNIVRRKGRLERLK